jgi:hypothetical protein
MEALSRQIGVEQGTFAAHRIEAYPPVTNLQDIKAAVV